MIKRHVFKLDGIWYLDSFILVGDTMYIARSISQDKLPTDSEFSAIWKEHDVSLKEVLE